LVDQARRVENPVLALGVSLKLGWQFQPEPHGQIDLAFARQFLDGGAEVRLQTLHPAGHEGRPVDAKRKPVVYLLTPVLRPTRPRDLKPQTMH
jgi:hypothetical protein